MPRKSIGDTPMTDAERQARCRAARAAGVPVVHTRQTIDRPSRAQRWRDAAAAGSISLQESAIAEALQAICELELADPLAIEPRRGFGRD